MLKDRTGYNLSFCHEAETLHTGHALPMEAYAVTTPRTPKLLRASAPRVAVPATTGSHRLHAPRAQAQRHPQPPDSTGKRKPNNSGPDSARSWDLTGDLKSPSHLDLVAHQAEAKAGKPGRGPADTQKPMRRSGAIALISRWTLGTCLLPNRLSSKLRDSDKRKMLL